MQCVFDKNRRFFGISTGRPPETGIFCKKTFSTSFPLWWIFCGKHLRRHPKWFSTMLKTVPDRRSTSFPQSCVRNFPLWGMRTWHAVLLIEGFCCENLQFKKIYQNPSTSFAGPPPFSREAKAIPHNKTGEAPVRCFACLLRHTAVPAITQLIPA